MFEKRPLREAIGAQLGGGTPPRAIASYWGGSIPWASVKDFTDDGAILASTVESITTEGLRASSSNLIPSGTPLVCTRMAVGRSALAPMPVAINQDVKALVPAEGVCGSYLLRLLQYIQPAAASAAIGSTVKGIRIQDYLSLPVPLAPQTEQEAIVEVLDTLDTTIRQTEAIIAKLKQVKQGLLHDLLTRGIDANGELRPPQSEAPHLYKASPLGWIPNAWDATLLGSAVSKYGGLIQTGPFGSQLHAHEYVEEGVPVIMPQDILDDGVDRRQIAMVSDLKAVSMIRHQVAPNDVVFSRRGDLSRCAAIDARESGWLCGTGCLLVRLPKSAILGHWLSMVYRQPQVQAQVLGMAVGSTMANLNTGILGALCFPQPPIAEQTEIHRRICALTYELQSEKETAAKLTTVKSGLMDDLLTGRVRVTPLLTPPSAT